MSPAGQAGSRVGDLSPADFAAQLRNTGIGVRIGPFDSAMQARVSGIEHHLQRLYRHYSLLPPGQVYSFHVRIGKRWQWLPRPRPAVRFLVDGRAPHPDLPREQALAVLEWGINLVIALRYQCFLMLHAAVVERDGRALVLPAEPGSGKTTLCAALVNRGWRLLSDEFGLLRPGTTDLIPLPRPMPLKNESIALLEAFAPQAQWGPVIPNTRKGTIRHLAPSRAAVDSSDSPAAARWIVFPQWRRDAALDLRPVSEVEGFAQIASNAFNYEMLGLEAFRTVAALVNACGCYMLDYSGLDDAVAVLDELATTDAC
jgi:HprK-related kinase A